MSIELLNELDSIHIFISTGYVLSEAHVNTKTVYTNKHLQLMKVQI